LADEEQPSDSRRPELLRAYQEWSDHRYDPGHYLGGNIEPHLDRHRLGRRARKKAAVLIAIMAAMSGMATLSGWAESGAGGRMLMVGWTAFVLTAAIRMYRP
jgi:hypothetical protein